MQCQVLFIAATLYLLESGYLINHDFPGPPAAAGGGYGGGPQGSPGQQSHQVGGYGSLTTATGKVPPQAAGTAAGTAAYHQQVPPVGYRQNVPPG
nr:unnamed protein product [Callosobruchus analis]